MLKNRVNFWSFADILFFLLFGFLIGFLAVLFVLQYQGNKHIKTEAIAVPSFTFTGREYGIFRSIDHKKNAVIFERRNLFSPEKKIISEIYFDKKTTVQKAFIFTKDDVVYGIRDTIESSIVNIRPGEYVIVYNSLIDNSKYASVILHGEYLF